MDIDELKYKVGKNFKLKVNEDVFTKNLDEREETLFHMPMLIFILLHIASNKNINLTTDNAVGWVVDTLHELHSNYILSAQRLRLSSKLRCNIVDGIVFLESTEMIEVKEKEISITEKGRKFLNKRGSKTGVSNNLFKRVKNATSRSHIRGSQLI